ncbi:MAG: DUF814 domain-containing protein [Bdellovibrio sp.]|nr:DUF814 domain-containing protein [Bdellovibrio sp.]
MYFLLSTSLPNYSKYFASWQGTVNEYSSQNGIDSPIHTALLELGKISDRGLKLSVQLSNALYQDMWQKLLSREANRKVKKLELKKDKIKADILHLQQAITKMETDLANSKEIEFGEFYECAGYRVKFPAQLNSWKKREMLFNKLKSLKKGYSIQKQRLDALKSGPGLSKFVPDIRPWNPTWGKQAGKKETTVTEKCSNKDVIEFNSDSNALVKIGRNENGNDYLLTTWSKASDIWVHLHEHPSAHAIIRFTDSKREQLFELLDDISLLLKDLSGMTKERVSLIYTERRWVKPIKNDKGKVKLSKFHIYLPRK